MTNSANIRYAGFWRRALALGMDMFIVVGVIALFWLSYFMAQVLGVYVEEGDVISLSTAQVGLFGDYLAASFNDLESLADIRHSMNTIFIWLFYVSMFESSPWQATPGKRLLGLEVTDYKNKQLSFPQALGRNVFKVFSDLTLGLGYVLAGVTKRKQALHDMTTKCLVIRKVH